METTPIDSIEQQQGNQPEQEDEKIGVQVPQIRKDHVAQSIDCSYFRHHLLICEAKEDGANQETQDARDQIIELAFAATGGASARSVSGEGHANAEDQPSDEVTDNISGRHRWELDHAQAAQPI